MIQAADTTPPAAATAATEEAPEARLAALRILIQVLDRGQPLDQVLETDRAFTALPGREKAFVRMLLGTVLRRLGQIDDFIRRASDRETPPHPPALRHVLRLGVAQIAFMAVPDYAVVDTAVRLAQDAEMSRQKGYVNAVLRRIAADWRGWAEKQDPPRLNTPDWLMSVWIADYGLRSAADIAQANLAEAPLDITLKDPAQAKHWAKTLGAAILPTGSLRRMEGGPVHTLPGFEDGFWWIQDAAAALPARLMGDVAGQTVVDLCAAPGGKTAQLAAAGAHVIALDRSVARLGRLRDNLRRLRLDDRVTVETADAESWTPKQPPAFILLDAPCTATGTARRHPDVLRLKTPRDLARLADTQSRLLAAAVRMLAPGGVLVYCTCSLQKDEGERQVDAVLQNVPSLERVPISATETGNLPAIITDRGDIRALPIHMAAHGGMDGFYAARLHKKR